MVRAGDGIHHVKCFPLDSVAAGHPNTVSRSGISERSGCYPHAIVATRDWLILTESLHVSRSRAESSPLPSSKRGNAKFDLLLDASRVAKPSRLV